MKLRVLPFRLLASALVLTVGGCAGFEPPRWPWETPAPAAGAARPPVADQPYTLKDLPLPRPPHAAPQGQAKLRPPAEKGPERAYGEKVPVEKPPERAAMPALLGLTEDQTAELLGRPAEEAAQPPGKVWTYRTDGCELLVHLFPDMERGGFYTLDYTAGEAPKDWCLRRVAVNARRG